MTGRRSRLAAHVSAALLVVPLALAGCRDSTATPGTFPGRALRLAVQADLRQTAATRVAVAVTGAGIDPAITAESPVGPDGTATVTVDVPAGAARAVSVRAFDAASIETHAGSATVDVLPGQTATADITLAPLAGGVRVTARVSSVLLVVAPVDIDVAAGSTRQLTASVTDGTGAPASTAGVRWATDNPGVATIDQATGLVTGRVAGTTRAVATLRGVAAAATVRVR